MLKSVSFVRSAPARSPSTVGRPTSISSVRATPTAYGLVLVLGLNGHQVATAGVSMTELADLLHEFACELAPDASPIATVASSDATDIVESQGDVIRRALQVAEQLTQAEPSAVGAAGGAETQLVLGRLRLDRSAYEVS